VVDRGPGSARLDAQAFLSLAGFLERAAEDGLRRVDAVAGSLRSVTGDGEALQQAWRSPKAIDVNRALTSFATTAASADGAGVGAFRALASLAGEARRVGQVIAEVEQFEKSWNQQLVANWSEWQDRVTTSAVALLPGTDDAHSAELTARYQEETRRAEDASRRREEALRAWHTTCGNVVSCLDAARAVYDRLGLDCPEPLRTPAAYAHSPGDLKAYVQREWTNTAVQRFLERNRTDRAAIEAWWTSLSPVERAAIITNRPDLVEAYLMGLLSDNERRALAKAEKHVSGTSKVQFELQGSSIDANLGSKNELTATVAIMTTTNSDGTVDVRFEVKGKFEQSAAFGLGPTLGGFEGRYAFTLKFTNQAEYEASKAKILDAQRADGWLGTFLLGSRSRDELTAAWQDHYRGFEVAGGVVADLEDKFGTNGTKIAATIGAGVYKDDVNQQNGLYLNGKIKISDPTTTTDLAIDGRLYWTWSNQRYVTVKLTGTGTATLPVLQALGASKQVTDAVTTDATATGGTDVTLKLEVTDANYDRVTQFLGGLASGRLDQADLATISNEVDANVLVKAGGTARLAGKGPTGPAPADPDAERSKAGLSATDDQSHTVLALRKPPGGSFVRLDD
jgi:hypothetical protein